MSFSYTKVHDPCFQRENQQRSKYQQITPPASFSPDWPIAARIVCKLTVSNAITIAATPASTKIHHGIEVR